MHKNGGGVLVVGEEDRKITLKNYHEKLLNADFVWVQNSFLAQIKLTKNKKAAGPSGLVS